MESARGPQSYRCSTAMMDVVGMMLMAVLFMSTVGGQSANLTSPCVVKYSQGSQITICDLTRPYSEVCFSGCCTYTCPPAFLDHLKKEHCEAAWYSPDMTSLADPSQPQNLSASVVNVTPQSLITKQHVDGLFIYINCHDTNKRYKAVYRVVSNISAPPPDQPRKWTMSSTVSVAVGSVGGLAILAAVAAMIYCRKWIRRQICGSENLGEEGMELRGQGGGEARVEEEEA